MALIAGFAAPAVANPSVTAQPAPAAAKFPDFMPGLQLPASHRVQLNRIGATLNPSMRAAFEVCANNTLNHSDFYRYVIRKEHPGEAQIGGTFIARTAVCLKQTATPAQWETVAATMQRIAPLMADGIASKVAAELNVKPEPAKPDTQKSGKKSKHKNKLKKPSLPAVYSLDTQAFNLILDAMFTKDDMKWQAVNFVYFPALHPNGTKFTISYQDVYNIARVCEAESDILDRNTGKPGVESCAAVVLNRLASGWFGHNIRQIFITGEFDAIRVHGQGKIEGLAAPKPESIAKVQNVILHHKTFDKAVFYANNYFTRRNGHFFSFLLSQVLHIGDDRKNYHELTDARRVIGIKDKKTSQWRPEGAFDFKGNKIGSYERNTVQAYSVPDYTVESLPPPPKITPKKMQHGLASMLHLKR